MSSPPRRVLVLGAGGKSGLLTLRRFKERVNEFDVVGACRTEASAAKVAQETGAKTVVCDLTVPDSAAKAMAGIDTLVVLSSATPKVNKLKMFGMICRKLCCQQVQFGSVFDYPRGGTPKEVDWEGGRAAIDAAAKAGVAHVIYVGSMGGTKPEHFLNKMGGGNILLWKRKAELHLVRSGLAYTIIHPGGLLPHFGAKPVPGGERELLVGTNDTLMDNEAKKRCIPREDVAEVVLQCALEPTATKNLTFDLSSCDPSLSTSIWNQDIRALLKTLGDKTYDFSVPKHPILENLEGDDVRLVGA